MTSVLALILAVPLSFGIAFFLTELAPILVPPPRRHGDRTARGDPLDHLRHVGLLRDRAADGAIPPALG